MNVWDPLAEDQKISNEILLLDGSSLLLAEVPELKLQTWGWGEGQRDLKRIFLEAREEKYTFGVNHI